MGRGAGAFCPRHRRIVYGAVAHGEQRGSMDTDASVRLSKTCDEDIETRASQRRTESSKFGIRGRT